MINYNQQLYICFKTKSFFDIMQTSNEVIHNGIVQAVDNDIIKVSILAESACVSCKAKGMCSVSEMKEKIIEVANRNYTFTKGDRVKVILSQRLGFRALFLGYILPFIVLMTALILSLIIIKNQGISALISIGILVPYYFVLYMFRDQIKNKFSFSLRE